MNDDPLYEFRYGKWYYKGLPTDTMADHKAKCEACRDFPEGQVEAHGQCMKNPLKHLLDEIEPPPEGTMFRVPDRKP